MRPSIFDIVFAFRAASAAADRPCDGDARYGNGRKRRRPYGAKIVTLFRPPPRSHGRVALFFSSRGGRVVRFDPARETIESRHSSAVRPRSKPKSLGPTSISISRDNCRERKNRRRYRRGPCTGLARFVVFTRVAAANAQSPNHPGSRVFQYRTLRGSCPLYVRICLGIVPNEITRYCR